MVSFCAVSAPFACVTNQVSWSRAVEKYETIYRRAISG